jgi:MFS family permease
VRRFPSGLSRTATAAVLGLAVGTSFFCRMTLSALQEPLKAGLSLTDNQVSLVQGVAMALAAVLGVIPIGLLVDRVNRVRLLNIFFFLNFAGTVATALSAGFAELFFSRAVVGFSTAAVAVTALSLLADLFPRAQRGRGSMILGVGQTLGIAAAFAVGGALVVAFRSSDAWRSATLVMSCPLLAAFLLSLLLREQERMEVALERPTLARSVGELWSFRGVYAPLLAGLIVAAGAGGAVLVWGVPTLSRSFGVSTGRGDSVMGAALLASGLLGPLIGGFAADRCLSTGKGGSSRAMALLAALAVLSSSLGLFAVAPGFGLASVGLTGFLLAGAVITTVSLTLITALLPNEIRGFSLAVLSVAQILFDTGLAPSLVSTLGGRLGGPASVGVALASVCVAAGAIAGVAFLVGRAYLQRNPAAGGRAVLAGSEAR